MDVSVLARMKQALGRAKVSQKLAAERIGVSEDTIGNYLSGKRIMPLDKFLVFCQTFEVSPLWLLFDRGPAALPLNQEEEDPQEKVAELALEILRLARSSAYSGDAHSRHGS